jgi:putative ABC transport system substrate-binding protein
MNRRNLLSLIGGAAVWPVSARAQQAGMPVIVFLYSSTLSTSNTAAFRQGLSEAGYVEGKNVAVEYRWAEGQNDRPSALADDLVRRQVTVIFASGNLAIVAARAATMTIPIVFYTGGDPVELGLVASLNRPSGNMTGVTVLGGELGPKRLELLHQLVPTANVIALMVNPTNPTVSEPTTRDVRGEAETLGLKLIVVEAGAEGDLQSTFATLEQQHANALVVSGDTLFARLHDRIVALAERHSIPAIYDRRDYVEAGGLISYGASLTDANRQGGIYAGRILQGAKPADLPVMQSSKFDLLINLKSAKALGLTVPPSLLALADEVIE